MYLCLCNPFTDKDVAAHLSVSGKCSMKSVYSACSGGEKMNCGNCACELKSMVDTHNNALTISEISVQMDQAAEKSPARETETV